MQHSVLGRRWVYEACFDPAYAAALATAIFTGGTQAELQVASDDGMQRREPSILVAGTGRPGSTVPRIHTVTPVSDQMSATIRTDELELVVRRLLDHDVIAGRALTLIGTWPGNDKPAVLALAHTH